jgi:hypothetical protein
MELMAMLNLGCDKARPSPMQTVFNLGEVGRMDIEAPKLVRNKAIRTHRQSNLHKSRLHNDSECIRGQVQVPSGIRRNTRRPKVFMTLLAHGATSPQKGNKLGVCIWLKQSKQQIGINTGPLIPNCFSGLATQVHPMMITNRSTGDSMQTPGPGNGAEHPNFGSIFGFAGGQLRPEVIKCPKPLNKGVIGPTSGNSKVPPKLTSLM